MELTCFFLFAVVMIFVDVQTYGIDNSVIVAKELAIYGLGVQCHAVYSPPLGVTNLQWRSDWEY